MLNNNCRDLTGIIMELYGTFALHNSQEGIYNALSVVVIQVYTYLSIQLYDERSSSCVADTDKYIKR
jgi:hypothetical protein